MSRARENADGARLDAPLASPAFTGTPTGITAAHLEAGVLPSDVTGGSGLTALGTVTEGNLSNTAIVYPAGHVIDTKIYRIRDLDYYQSTASTDKVCTAISDSSTGQLSFSAVSGNTYIITYSQFQQGYRNSGVDTSTRYWHGSMQVKNADITVGTTNTAGQTSISSGYTISGGIWGRDAVATVGGGANSWTMATYVGGYYASATETLYVYLTASPPAANHKVRVMCSDYYPANCVIKTIKGNALTIS